MNTRHQKMMRQHPDVIFKRFQEIKEGPTLDALKESRENLTLQLQFFRDRCSELPGLIRDKLNTFEDLQNAQSFLRDTNLALRMTNDQIQKFNARKELASKQELSSILDIPAVIGVRNDSQQAIIFTVHATIVCSGSLFDMGVWDLYIGRSFSTKANNGDLEYYRARLVRDVRLRERNDYPYDYTYPDKSFCFGGLAKVIDRHACNGNVVHAVQTAVHALCSVNDEAELARVPVTFPLIRKGMS